MKVFVVASDPGSANALMPVIAACCRNGHEVYGVVSGSAATMFGKQWQEIKKIDDAVSKEKILNIWKDNKPHIVLAGAGAYNLLEHSVRVAAAKAKIPCIAILDYWTNYFERFRRLEGKQWSYSLPDRICVLDEIVCNEMLAEGFTSEQIVVTGQPYFEYISNWKETLSIEDVKCFRNRFVKDEMQILIGFCSEPIVEDMDVIHGENLCYTQYNTIEKIAYILERLAKSKKRHIHLIIRPHPREDEAKLNTILREIKTTPMFSYEISKIGTSLEFIVSCDLVIGMTSMVLIEASFMSHPVLSVQLNLKSRDTFFGTTRGYCPSVYKVQRLEKRLEQWIEKPIQSSIKMPSAYGATNNIIEIMKELVYQETKVTWK